MAKLISMYGKIKFNRDLNKFNDNISIGQFSIIDKNNKKLEFDFCDFSANIDNNDYSLLSFCCKNPDIDSFPNMNIISIDLLKNIKCINEFNYYTESKNDDLLLVSCEELIFEIYKDNSEVDNISIPKNILSNIKFNKCD